HPSMVLAARLPELDQVRHWLVPADGAHGLDIDHDNNLLYTACDGGALVELDATSGQARGQWPLPGVPDVTFFNPASGLVHVAIADPGVVPSVHARSGSSYATTTAGGAHTPPLSPPPHLSPSLPTPPH